MKSLILLFILSSCATNTPRSDLPEWLYQRRYGITGSKVTHGMKDYYVYEYTCGIADNDYYITIKSLYRLNYNKQYAFNEIQTYANGSDCAVLIEIDRSIILENKIFL